MASKLIQQVAKRITVDYCRLTFVRNTDGFLNDVEVCTLLNQECQVEVVRGSQLQLRLHYELEYKSRPDERFVYVCLQTDTLLPDMLQEGKVLDFSVSDLFPLFADKVLIRRQPLQVLEWLYDEVGLRRISLSEGRLLVETLQRRYDEQRNNSVSHLRERLQRIDVNWSDCQKTIDAVSAVMVDAIKAGVIEDLDSDIERINIQFQDWLNEHYFAMLQSNPLLNAKSVNKILPHLAANYQHEDKVALMVIDGLAYWQYIVLKRYLDSLGVKTQDSTIVSWLPSITMLSRQAIFRGNTPAMDYHQSPDNERKLWRSYWQSQGIGQFETQYISDDDEFAINEGVKRLAVVTVEMDKKMHSSYDYRDLLSLTENWCPRIATKIKTIIEAGYTLYLTTDHGSVLSKGWRLLTQVEKVFLYKDGSRGKRHLMYNNVEEYQRFAKENSELEMLAHDHWLCMRRNLCFARDNERMITHGGSHFEEVVIPFVKVKSDKFATALK